MTKEELEKEARKDVDSLNGVDLVSSTMVAIDRYGAYKIGRYDGYLAGAEPREKQIQIDAEQIRALQKQNGELTDKVKELEAQIEKLIDFVLSKTECCDVCSITDTCINSEGTCPYAGILSKGEEETTREWLMQKIVKEKKEK